VDNAEYSDPRAARYLSQVLIKRRDKIIDHYFGEVNPLADFEVDAGSLQFRNLGDRFGLAAGASFRYQWFLFDNATGDLTPLGEKRYTGLTRIPIPRTAADFTMIRIRTYTEDKPAWNKAVEVYLRSHPTPRIVGVERETN
jgi:hypothetical protein